MAIFIFRGSVGVTAIVRLAPKRSLVAPRHVQCSRVIHSLSTAYPQYINNLFTSTSTSEVDIAKTIYKFNDLRVPKLSTIVIHRLIHSALQHMLRCVIIRCSTWNIIGVHHAKICLRSVKKCERVGKCRVCQYYPTRARIEKYTADPAPAYTHPLLRAQKSHATD